jgi:hypothetical protein
MVKNLQKYLSVLIGVVILSNVALAQVEKGKSRLDIGKKPTTTAKSALPKTAFVSKPMPSEVRLNKPSVVNQYFRNALLNGSAKPVISKTSNSEIPATNDRSIGGNENSDKLYSSEKITVSNIYPNPADNQLVVNFGLSKQAEVEVEIFDKLGKKLKSEAIEVLRFGNYFKQISLNEFSSGIFLVRLRINDQYFGKTLIVK